MTAKSRVRVDHDEQQRTQVQSHLQDEGSATEPAQPADPPLDHPDSNKVHKWISSAYHLGSLRLENKGAVARDHLANERTFLAWMRTSMTFATLGVGLSQLLRLSDSATNVNDPQDQLDKIEDNKRLARIAGALFVSAGIVVLLLGTTRYFHSQHMIVNNHFPVSRMSVLFVMCLTLALVGVIIWMVLRV
ncbi:hypothetical protein B0I72DRAFT_134265 [Yarrowia lipolytica]|uniref:YALI0F14685p n=2 Tax=Yarrowia lipolytica TaxID=4952 RepID=Q6C1N8_YARLI|nr:YALI0F14685p [Yarrowia lipolytica CLIB122]AOW07186.1 hypothetical protein YALI1_F19610g [Yarrowia lipolytica]KAB8281706.1 hypothetical protein BKA91DRAFT_139758 [Yarrowia lipolytica]KAE8171927.1 hypothetical protein BKA90DRAFT_138225 [Yarrowia lipolytica]KAJ8055697.1 hypothetical protein LXG23DRAFT_18199 [Yarrowia lipolytica]QNQ01137.1 Hypothetical protein YALI2_F00682g [Yarrowia lipolytica]|eukprot:XP_505424.1 YALI0F14685p [Yarrowia lipolytica CLIB122]